MVDALIITGDRDSEGKKDFSGAFRPEAEQFKKVHDTNANIICIDTSKSMANRKKQLFSEIEKLAKCCKFDVVAFFMHGWSSGIQCGLRIQDIKDFVSILKPCILYGDTPNYQAYFLLYCCLTGSGESIGGNGGFADRLRDELCLVKKPWCRVYSHTTAGHTTRNPYARVFDGKGSLVGGVDGEWMIRPPSKGVKSPLWRKWVDALWSRKNFSTGKMNAPFSILSDKNDKVSCKDFRFIAPFMTTEELHATLLK